MVECPSTGGRGPRQCNRPSAVLGSPEHGSQSPPAARARGDLRHVPAGARRAAVGHRAGRPAGDRGCAGRQPARVRAQADRAAPRAVGHGRADRAGGRRAAALLHADPGAPRGGAAILGRLARRPATGGLQRAAQGRAAVRLHGPRTRRRAQPALGGVRLPRPARAAGRLAAEGAAAAAHRSGHDPRMRRGGVRLRRRRRHGGGGAGRRRARRGRARGGRLLRRRRLRRRRARRLSAHVPQRRGHGVGRPGGRPARRVLPRRRDRRQLLDVVPHPRRRARGVGRPRGAGLRERRLRRLARRRLPAPRRQPGALPALGTRRDDAPWPDRAGLARGFDAAQRARLRPGRGVRVLWLRLPARREAVDGEDMAGRRGRGTVRASSCAPRPIA